MENRFASRGGEESGIKHEILKGDPFERLLDHMEEQEVITPGERAEYLSKHLEAQEKAANFQRLDVRDQLRLLQEAKTGRGVLETLRRLVSKVTTH